MVKKIQYSVRVGYGIEKTCSLRFGFDKISAKRGNFAWEYCSNFLQSFVLSYLNQQTKKPSHLGIVIGILERQDKLQDLPCDEGLTEVDCVVKILLLG